MRNLVFCAWLLIGSLFFKAHPTIEILKQESSTEWHAQELGFRALNVTAQDSTLWICGTDESIARSNDNGVTWVVQHKLSDGGLLLNIDFANPKFGYATGTGGVVLITSDGGETWTRQSPGTDTILQASFADPQHGLIRTQTSLLFTSHGAANWSPVSTGQNSKELKEFPYTFSLVALDEKHMAVMLKQGSAQYEHQAILFTEDSGESWHLLEIPNTTLYSFLRVDGRYWVVGTEVIHKDQPGGGYGVPVALYSSDGKSWNHSPNDLSACKSEMCTICRPEGCLSSNGVVTQIFRERTSDKRFPPKRELTAKWGATESTVCFVGGQVECATLGNQLESRRNESIPLPTLAAPGPLGASRPTGPNCISCELDRIFVDKKAQGSYRVRMVLQIAKNGVVTSAQAEGAPSPEIKSRIEQQAQQWIFEPYLKDQGPVNVKLNTIVQITAIKPR